MALKGASKYCNTTVPATGVSTTTVCTTGFPIPTSSEANEVLFVNTGDITLALSGAATTNTYRAFILPAGYVVVDAAIETITTAAAGKCTLGFLATGAALNDGGTAGTADAFVTNSNIMTASAVASAGIARRTLAIPAVTTDASTKAYSPGVAVPYDRVIGILTDTAITTNDAVVRVCIWYAAV